METLVVELPGGADEWTELSPRDLDVRVRELDVAGRRSKQRSSARPSTPTAPGTTSAMAIGRRRRG